MSDLTDILNYRFPGPIANLTAGTAEALISPARNQPLREIDGREGNPSIGTIGAFERSDEH
jgi:hypothetical protein